ncbi:hypothetical protein E7742_10595 [Rhodococcus sp. SGAir0479]|nr:hypothetical protein E7742_10595 [Rhodococcus sp. SGAir0479]
MSTTVDVRDCESTDSNQRQFMADLVRGDYRHAADFSRAPSRVRIARPVVETADVNGRADGSAGEEPGDDDQDDQRDQRQGHA